MHDFEAANSDELELKRGDVVLVVPTASVEDQVRPTAWWKRAAYVLTSSFRLVVIFLWLVLQDAGWLTGIKESDWLTHGAAAQKGLFPENFTQRLD